MPCFATKSLSELSGNCSDPEGSMIKVFIQNEARSALSREKTLEWK